MSHAAEEKAGCNEHDHDHDHNHSHGHGHGHGGGSGCAAHFGNVAANADLFSATGVPLMMELELIK
jgi:hypothetical protein